MQPPGPSPRRPTMNAGTRSFILTTTFLNFAGIGIIVPVTAYIVAKYAAPDQVALISTLLFTAYSLCTFLAVPTLGALSDKYGRRPVLLISLLGSAVGYYVYGAGGALVFLFLGRIIDGLTGGNIATIYAYSADITEPKERTAFFGMLGAVGGLAFVIGPTLGGLVYAVTRSYEAPLFFAGTVTLLNVIWGLFAMPESLSPDRRSNIQLARLNPFSQLAGVLGMQQLRLIFVSIFLWTMSFALWQSTLSVLTEDRFRWQPDGTSAVLAFVGVIGIVMQSLVIPRLLKRFPEGRLATSGMVILAFGFSLLGLTALTLFAPLIFVAALFVAIGNGLITPTVTGLVSQSVGFREQGRVQGGNQAVQALARVVGPLWAGATYATSAAIPYFSAAGFALVGAALIAVALPILAAYKAKMPPVVAPAASGAGGAPPAAH